MSSSGSLENVLNFRDVGKTVNEFLGQRRVREGLLYRSARLDDATLDDRAFIKDDIGIKTVIDLRTKTEHLTQAKKRDAQSKIPALLKSNAALAEPLQIEGLDYHEIKITGRPFEMFMLGQLSWWNLLHFLFLFICGYRMQAISVIGREVMIPRGLVGLGLDTLDQSTVEIRETLSLYADAAALPSVVHCTQGKDRTVLLILGVPIPAIEHDYSLTDEALIPEREERLVEIHEIGLTDEWADTAKDFVVRVEQHLNERYGGLDKYLDEIGFGGEARVKVRETLLY
ncbi:Fc.00g053380.m01.CDS01 [Cosmosporella sp. VM-42]